MFEKFKSIFANRLTYDQPTQDTISDLNKKLASVEDIETMKETSGWQEIEKRLKDEVKLIMLSLLADDKSERAGRINACLQILNSVNTKTMREEVEQAVDSLFPNS